MGDNSRVGDPPPTITAIIGQVPMFVIQGSMWTVGNQPASAQLQRAKAKPANRITVALRKDPGEHDRAGATDYHLLS